VHRRTRRALLNFSLWREEDFMRQCGNDFEVIPRWFDGEKRIEAAALRP
jgi:hypothetical protein